MHGEYVARHDLRGQHVRVHAGDAPLPMDTEIVYVAKACPELVERAAGERPAWVGAPDSVIHRIVAVGQVDGGVAYRAKSDANARVYECWVPHSAVLLVAVKR